MRYTRERIKKKTTNKTKPKYSGLGEGVVYEMTKSLQGKYHEVYVDSYFTSVPLMEYLFSHQVLCCGTLCTNRKYLPTNLRKDKDLRRGGSDYRVSTNDDIVIYKWMDNKAAYVISNFHSTETTKIKRKNKDGTIELISSPQTVNDYNTYMGGVGKGNTFCSLYHTYQKSKNWWHSISFGIIDRTVCNAYVVYKILTNEKIDLLYFRRSVAPSMITKSKTPKLGRSSTQSNQRTAKKRQKSSYSVPASICKENHGIYWLDCDAKRGRCEVCYKKKQGAKPFMKCSACKVHLCVNGKRNCFKEYHE